MKRTRYSIIGLAALLAAVFAVSAMAAKPKPGSYVDGNDSRIKITLDVAKSKKKLTPSYYNDCSPVPVVYKAKIKKKSGKFKYEGTVENVIGEDVDVELNGKFVSKKKAKGTVAYTTKDCKAKPEDFVAKYQKNS